MHPCRFMLLPTEEAIRRSNALEEDDMETLRERIIRTEVEKMSSVSKKNKRRREVCIDSTELDMNILTPKRKSQRLVQLEDLGVSSSGQAGCTEGNRAPKTPQMSNRGLCVDLGVSSSVCRSSDMDELPAYNVLPSWAICVHCGAVKFSKESKGFCCSDGQVHLQSYAPPTELALLFTSICQETTDFLRYVRSYNCNFSMTSFGVHCDKSLFKDYNGIYTFRIQGQVYHFLNDIIPSTNTPSYLQLYLFDSDEEINNRLSFGNNLTEVILTKLINVLSVNPYVKFFRSLGNCNNLKSQTIRIRCDPGLDQRRYNAPTVSQVAAVCVDTNDTTDLSARDIVVHCIAGEHHKIHHYFGCYDPLQYPLLFPYGESGWHRGIKLVTKKQRSDSFCNNADVINPDNFLCPEDLINNELKVSHGRNSRADVSCREYYCYKLQVRPDYEEEEFATEGEVKNKPGKAPHHSCIPIEEEMNQYKLERMLEKRHKTRANFVTYADDGYEHKTSTKRNIYLPSAKDPTI